MVSETDSTHAGVTLHPLRCPHCGRFHLEYEPGPYLYLRIPCKNCKNVIKLDGYVISVEPREARVAVGG
jgi:phage FluMu protein Com